MTNPQTQPSVLSKREIEEIEARANAATEGPWVYFGEPEDNVFWGEIRSAADEGHFAHITDTPELDERDSDMEFIAHARTDIPALCQTVRALRTEREGLIADLNETRRLAFNRGQENTALRQQLTEAQDQLQLAAYAAEEYKRQAIAAISGVEQGRDDLREQLGHAVTALQQVRRVVGAREIGADTEAWIDDIIDKAREQP